MEIHAAISLITEDGKGGVLELTHEVQEALQAKHPEPQPAFIEALIQGSTQSFWKTSLDKLSASLPASEDHCNAVSEVARHLATNHVDPKGLMPIGNNRLITLDENSGVQPVGIGEVLRHIICKSLMTVLKVDITRAAGISQLSAG